MTIDIHAITDRASWLAFRAEWRIDYRNASEDVRTIKREMRSLVADRRSGARSADVVDGRMSSSQYDREMARRDANRLMRRLEAARKHRDALLAARTDDSAQAA